MDKSNKNNLDLDFYLDKRCRFNSRCQAIIYNKNKTKVLLFKVLDGRDFYMLPGGRIKFNEKSAIAIKREVKEETGYDLNYEFVRVDENFINKCGVDIMQYAFCYKAIYDGGVQEKFRCKDNNMQMFYWIDINKIYYLRTQIICFI